MTRPGNAFRPALSTLAVLALLLAAQPGASEGSDDEQAVKDLVHRFLIAMGEGNLDDLPAMFVPNANIATASMHEGKWVASTKTFADWHVQLKARETWTRFQEPVAEFTVHVEDGQMAFARADATLIVDGRVVSHNIDYFTLVRNDGDWKFLSASYVAKPVPADQVQ